MPEYKNETIPVVTSFLLEGITVRLSRVGWNKRSGSAKRERDIFKV